MPKSSISPKKKPANPYEKTCSKCTIPKGRSFFTEKEWKKAQNQLAARCTSCDRISRMAKNEKEKIKRVPGTYKFKDFKLKSQEEAAA